jgi:hypothetical protein
VRDASATKPTGVTRAQAVRATDGGRAVDARSLDELIWWGRAPRCAAAAAAAILAPKFRVLL